MLSVPPEVKVMQAGSVPSAAATAARLSSSRARALRPGAWSEPGLPKSSMARSAAARAAGMGAVVAALSR